MKKYLTICIAALAILILACSFVSASSIVSSDYQGSGFNSFMNGARAYEGSNLTHNSTFTSEITLNVSDCKNKLENFSGASDIQSISVSLKDNNGHTKIMDNKSLTVDSCSLDGDTLTLTVSGSEMQHITSSGQLANMFNYDNATVKDVNIKTAHAQITAKA